MKDGVGGGDKGGGGEGIEVKLNRFILRTFFRSFFRSFGRIYFPTVLYI